MPDVFTHLMVGASIALLTQRKEDKIEQVLIILGSVLIDIERPLTWLLNTTELYWIEFGAAFHSIIGAFVLSFFAAACFGMDRPPFDKRFKLVVIGSISHLILDMTMYPWMEMGIYLLYPLEVPVSFHLFWPDFCLLPILGMSLLLVSIIVKSLVLHMQSSEETT